MSERCDGSDPRLTSLVDGEGARDQRRKIASHVVLCRDCAAEVGQMVAQKVLLERGVEAAKAGPPRDLWREIIAGLDKVDGAQTALARRPATRPSRVPALVMAGAALVFVALLASAYVARPTSPTGQLLAAHNQAMAAAGMNLPTGPGLQSVATGYEPPSLHTRWRAIEKVNGAFAVHRLCMAGRLPVSVISAPAEAVPTAGMERVTISGREMFVAATADGAVVAVLRQGMATVLIANTTPDDLMAIALSVAGTPLATFP
jgi:hypothetical protein